MSKIIDPRNSPSFFPAKKQDDLSAKVSPDISSDGFDRQSDQKQQIDKTSKQDARVTIPDSIKDFAKIKRATDQAPDIDNSAKIRDLKNRINAGTYQVDVDALTDQIMAEEFWG